MAFYLLFQTHALGSFHESYWKSSVLEFKVDPPVQPTPEQATKEKKKKPKSECQRRREICRN